MHLSHHTKVRDSEISIRNSSESELWIVSGLIDEDPTVGNLASLELAYYGVRHGRTKQTPYAAVSDWMRRILNNST